MTKSETLTAEDKSRAIARARGVSEVGNSIRQAILALAILSVRDRPHDLFLAEVLESAGYLAMSFIAPFFVDRLRRMRSLIVSDVLALLNSGLLIVGVMRKDLLLLWVGSFLMTFLASFYGTSLYAVTAQYAGGAKREVRLGLSYLQLNILIGALVGLLGSALVLPKLSFEILLAFDALTFLVSSLWIFWIARADLAKEPSRKFRYDSYRGFLRGLVDEWRDGFRGMLRSGPLRKLILGNCLTCFGYGIFESSVVSTQKIVLGFSHSLVTLTRALNRVSAIAGSFFVARFSQTHRSWTGRRFLFLGGGISAVGTAAMTFASAPLFVGANVFYNFGWSFLNPTVGSEVAQETDQRMLGRVQAFRSLLVNLSILLGNVCVLVLSDVLGIQRFFALTSVVFVVALFFWRQHPVDESPGLAL